MKILLVSDIESPYIWDNFQPEKFKDIDLMISCGDLKSEYLSFLVTMIKAPLFYVYGNHNESYFENPPEGCESIDNKFVKYKNIRILGIGGCKGYGPKKLLFTDEEMKRKVRKMTRRILWNKGLDILVTHAAAYGIGDDKDLCHEGFKAFNEIIDKYSPKYFIHGHVHLNYLRQKRILQYKNTTVINAYDHYILEY
ncbi:MAG: metallophosphoesterase family protein [Clostridiales bacterium]|nr:metallophosphoesterase family protein [Clostridiales bacterium]HBM80281.1 metallophosphoesterase [Clostridiaceae bacterium]